MKNLFAGQNIALSAEDAALLVSAHRELLETQWGGVQVFGSTDGGELLARAYELLADVAKVPAELEIVNDVLGVAA